ncbi:MAG: hypothetical protein GKR87_01065 [Kiritimatiellae bacterium]|nr:hypothetical protein [Kiritimatiellia bacterium]
MNLSCRAKTVLDLYHGHGPSEQYHSELKSDLDVERLPSGRLCANKIILLCAMVAFNLSHSPPCTFNNTLRRLPKEAYAPKWSNQSESDLYAQKIHQGDTCRSQSAQKRASQGKNFQLLSPKTPSEAIADGFRYL